MTLSEVQERYPYMFEGEHIGHEVQLGWTDVFGQVCQEVDQLLGPDPRRFHWTQLKEKFGSARWYYSLERLPGELIERPRVTFSSFNPADGSVTRLNPTDSVIVHKSVSDRIAAVIQAGQDKTSTICIICGDAGSPDVLKDYALVLCKKHAKERRNGGLRRYWSQD